MKTKKPVIFSKVFKFLLLIAFGTLLTFVLYSNGVPNFFIFIIILLLFMAISIVWPFYVIYWSKSIRIIDSYVLNNHKRPIFGYAYALAHGTNREIEEALKRIMNTYSQEDMRDTYGANLAFFQNDPKKIMEHANRIKAQEYKDYYLGLAHILNKNDELADSFHTKLRTPWMIHSLHAFSALERKDQQTFEQEAKLAVKHAVGMQRFVIHHMMQKFKSDRFLSS